MRRRDFISLVGGAAVWPVAARSQQAGRVPLIGIIEAIVENDSEGRARIGGLRGGLAKLGWIDGRNVQIEYRWGNRDKPDDSSGHRSRSNDEDTVRGTIRASSPFGLHQQAGHMTASDLCAARQMISCQAGAIHT